MRDNPWMKNQLYFRYGFWDLEPNANMMYHVTPKLSAILDSAELSSRASRNSKVEGLGGSHDVSVSYYGSLNRAAFTLMYLYRIWQVKEGILTIHDLAEVAGWDDDLIAIVERQQPHELVDQVRMSLGAPNPIVLGDSWADGLTEDDFAILCFKNPCKHLYVQDLLKLSRRSDDTTIKALTQDSIQELRHNVAPRCYFGSHSDGLDSSIYHEIRNLLHKGESQITYGEASERSWHSGWGNYEDRIREVFIGPSYYYPKEWYGQDVIQFKNITIDLRRQPVTIGDLCLYHQGEQEFQIFRSMPMSDICALHTIRDILREAKERNGGVEPFFWDMGYDIEGSQSWADFELSTWEEPLEPVGDTLCERVASLKPEICVVAQEVYDEWDEDEFEYFGGGICHLIADAIVDYLQSRNIDAIPFSQQIDEVHVFTIAYDENTREACEVDIDPRIYESGAGYSWTKIEGVTFEPNHVWVGPIDFEDDLWAD